MSVAILFTGPDVEAASFAKTILGAIPKSWRVDPPVPTLLQVADGSTPITGVQASPTAPDDSRRAATLIVEKLRSFGFDVVEDRRNSNPTHAVEIIVGVRPEGPQGSAKLRALSGK